MSYDDLTRIIREDDYVRQVHAQSRAIEAGKINWRNRNAPENHPSRIEGRARDLTRAHLKAMERVA